MLRVLKKTAVGFFVILCTIFIALLVAEGIVRLFKFDWRYMSKLLYYQMCNPEIHQHDPNPNLLYRMKPSSKVTHGGLHGYYTATTNSLGFRDKEREIEKRPGVFRIICLGGSNVFGFHLNDDETWPAQLEAKLNSIMPGRFEVWNLGVQAYVGLQMAALGEEAIEKYDPDLIIIALSNLGSPAFLRDREGEYHFRYYFDKYPYFWERLLYPGKIAFIPVLPYKTKIELIRKSGLFRLGIFALLETKGQQARWTDSYPNNMWENQSIRAIRKLIEKHSGKTQFLIFLCPAIDPQNYHNYTTYYEGLDAHVLKLRAECLPREYENIHPPAYVMKWYAEELTEWLLNASVFEREVERSSKKRRDNLALTPYEMVSSGEN